MSINYHVLCYFDSFGVQKPSWYVISVFDYRFLLLNILYYDFHIHMLYSDIIVIIPSMKGYIIHIYL